MYLKLMIFLEFLTNEVIIIVRLYQLNIVTLYTDAITNSYDKLGSSSTHIITQTIEFK